MKIIIPQKKSRPVEFKDLWKVFKDSCKIKWAMLSPFPGKYPFASSISHCQIESEDPLRFFVVDREGGMNEQGVRLRQSTKLKRYFGWPRARTIMNPEIVWESPKMIKSPEACMSFPDGKIRQIKRPEITEMKYWTFFGKRQKKFYLYRSCLVNHEIDHFNNVEVEDRWKHKI